MHDDDRDGIDLCYSVQLDEPCAEDIHTDIETVPANRLDESRGRDDKTTDRNISQFDNLDHRFLCSFKVVNATCTDDPSTPIPIEKPDLSISRATLA